jgi:hypothetical protein
VGPIKFEQYIAADAAVAQSLIDANQLKSSSDILFKIAVQATKALQKSIGKNIERSLRSHLFSSIAMQSSAFTVSRSEITTLPSSSSSSSSKKDSIILETAGTILQILASNSHNFESAAILSCAGFSIVRSSLSIADKVEV